MTHHSYFRRFGCELALLLSVLTFTHKGLADVPRKILHGHVPSIVSRLSALGNVTATNHLNLAIGLPLRDPAGLDDFLAQVYDPASTNYHRYLTPQEFADRFGPTESDYTAVVQFARASGLTVTATHGNRLLVDVNGSVGNIQQAFHLQLLSYQHPTEARKFFAPDREPTVDASLPVADISGLSDYVRPHPKSLKANLARANALPRSGSGEDGTYIGNDFRAAYLPGVTLNGAGQMVGLVQFDGFYASDITTYAATAGFAAVPIQTVLLDGYSGTPTTGSDSGNIEVSLDAEMVMAMAPGLTKIIMFEGGPSGIPNDILNAMVSSNQVKQLSSSWGWGGGPTTTTDTIFKEMAAQGQSFFNASGDSDAFTVGSTSANGVDNASLDNTPSSSPYITEVGGTTLTTSGPGGAWVSESVWNWGLDDGNYVGSSGGISSYYAIPTWQTNVNMSANGGSTTHRNIPDVALTGDNVYVLYNDGTPTPVGGTSCAAPLWAGLAAIINEQAVASGKSTIGFINPAIYALGTGSSYSTTFHDITTGSNAWSSSPSSYYAVSGYDLCSGWGTPIGQGLINALAGTADPLTVSPAIGFTASGPVGGPFNVSSESVVLTNTGSSALTWSLVNTSTWLNASSTTGSLAAHGMAIVTLSLAAGAANLGAGGYFATVNVTNWLTHYVQSGTVTLQIGQSLVQNGGFEMGSFTSWTLVGNTIVTGRNNQSTVYNAVESNTNYPLVVHSGSYGAFLGDTELASLSQTVSTIPGQNYYISLWLDNPVSGSGQEFAVNWITNGTTSTLYSVISPGVMSWTNLQFIVSATSSSATLQLEAENAADYFGVDDVSVTPVPAVTFRAAVKTTSQFQLMWNTASNLVYQVQYKTNLTQNSWINWGAPITATTSTLTLSDTNILSPGTQRFYRLTVAP